MAVGSVRVLLAVHCAETRERCCDILRSACGFDVVAEAADVDSALGLNRVFQPGLMLLELGLVGDEIQTVLRKLRFENPPVRVIVLDGQEDGIMITHLLQWGAVGYVRAADAEQELLPAMQMAKRGGVWVDAALLGMMVAGCTEDKPGAGVLGPDEQSVLALARRGASSDQIARELNLSTRTVRARLRRIHDRLWESSRIVAAMWEFELDLGSLPPLEQQCAPRPVGRPSRIHGSALSQVTVAQHSHGRAPARVARAANAPKRTA